MTVGDIDNALIWCIVVIPFVDWAAWAVLYTGHRKAPDVRALTERARIAFAIAVGTTLVWPLSLMAVAVLPPGAITGDVTILLLALGLLVPSLLNASWALRIGLDWFRDRRDGAQ